LETDTFLTWKQTDLKIDRVAAARALFHHSNDLVRMSIKYIEMTDFVAAEERLEEFLINKYRTEMQSNLRGSLRDGTSTFRLRNVRRQTD
jgi:hypothetical protein